LTFTLTETGQRLQAMTLLKNSGAVGSSMYYSKLVKQINNTLFDRYGDKVPGVQLNYDLVGDLAVARSEADRAAIGRALEADIVRQLPPTNWMERANSWRHLAMLGNTRTQVKNIVGNAAFVAPVYLRDKLAAAVERALPREQRTKVLRVASQYRELAALDYERNKDAVSSGGRENRARELLDARPAFGTSAAGRFANALNNVVSNAMRGSDNWFKQRYYIPAMGGYLQSRGVDVSGGLDSIGAATLDAAREYATNQALKNTFNDFDAVAKRLNELARTNTAAGVIVEGLLPFKKTPINILKRGLSFSPLGLLDGITRGSYQLANGEITSAEYVEKLASGLTGTGVAIVGGLLRSAGVLTGYLDPEEPEDKLLLQAGYQSYSVRVGDKSFSLDWMAPIAMPLFMGAEAYDALTGENPVTSLAQFADSLTAVGNPLFNLSMLDGVNTAIEQAANYTQGGALTAFGVNAATGYASQFVPTIMGQAARIVDPTRRKLYTDKNVPVAANIQYAWQRVENKIPGYTMAREPWLDVWGEPDVETNAALRVLENLVSPGYINTVSEDAVEYEVRRVFETTGDAGVIPRSAGKYFTADGETLNLSATQHTAFQRERGQTAKRVLGALTRTDAYQAWEDTVKASAIKQTYALANAMGKKAVTDGSTIAGWQAGIARLIGKGDMDGAVGLLVDKVNADEADRQAAAFRQILFDNLDAGAIDDAMMGVEALMNAKVEQGRSRKQARGDVKSSVTSHFKLDYQNADADDDVDRMREIENLLLSLGLGYSFADFRKWLED
jgi:ribosomal protein S17E